MRGMRTSQMYESGSQEKDRSVVMHVLWGYMIALIGIVMFVCGRLQSNFIIYRLLVTRSKVLWGKNVHRFFQVTGVMVTIFGILLAAGYIPMK